MSAYRCVSHLHPRADWCDGIHLGEADCLAVNSRGLLDHDGRTWLALRPGGRRGVGWFWLGKKRHDYRRHFVITLSVQAGSSMAY